MYLETHKRKGGSFVNEEARILGEQIESYVTQCNESEASPSDIIGKLFGEEHSGRSNDSKCEPTSPVDTSGAASDNDANHL
ncbi:hypothetical protein P3S67_010433 [Capsicum chacoense]